MSETEIAFVSNYNYDCICEVELTDYNEVEEHLIDLIFNDRVNLLRVLQELEPAFKNEKIFVELYVTMQYDYYYKKMPYVFYEIVKDLINKSKESNKLILLIEIILKKFDIDIDYTIDV
jgi:hypothetical protein